MTESHLPKQPQQQQQQQQQPQPQREAVHDQKQLPQSPQQQQQQRNSGLQLGENTLFKQEQLQATWPPIMLPPDDPQPHDPHLASHGRRQEEQQVQSQVQSREPQYTDQRQQLQHEEQQQQHQMQQEQKQQPYHQPSNCQIPEPYTHGSSSASSSSASGLLPLTAAPFSLLRDPSAAKSFSGIPVSASTRSGVVEPEKAEQKEEEHVLPWIELQLHLNQQLDQLRQREQQQQLVLDAEAEGWPLQQSFETIEDELSGCQAAAPSSSTVTANIPGQAKPCFQSPAVEPAWPQAAPLGEFQAAFLKRQQKLLAKSLQQRPRSEEPEAPLRSERQESEDTEQRAHDSDPPQLQPHQPPMSTAKLQLRPFDSYADFVQRSEFLHQDEQVHMHESKWHQHDHVWHGSAYDLQREQLRKPEWMQQDSHQAQQQKQQLPMLYPQFLLHRQSEQHKHKQQLDHNQEEEKEALKELPPMQCEFYSICSPDGTQQEQQLPQLRQQHSSQPKVPQPQELPSLQEAPAPNINTQSFELESQSQHMPWQQTAPQHPRLFAFAGVQSLQQHLESLMHKEPRIDVASVPESSMPPSPERKQGQQEDEEATIVGSPSFGYSQQPPHLQGETEVQQLLSPRSPDRQSHDDVGLQRSRLFADEKVQLMSEKQELLQRCRLLELELTTTSGGSPSHEFQEQQRSRRASSTPSFAPTVLSLDEGLFSVDGLESPSFDASCSRAQSFVLAARHEVSSGEQATPEDEQMQHSFNFDTKFHYPQMTDTVDADGTTTAHHQLQNYRLPAVPRLHLPIAEAAGGQPWPQSDVQPPPSSQTQLPMRYPGAALAVTTAEEPQQQNLLSKLLARIRKEAAMRAESQQLQQDWQLQLQPGLDQQQLQQDWQLQLQPRLDHRQSRTADDENQAEAAQQVQQDLGPLGRYARQQQEQQQQCSMPRPSGSSVSWQPPTPEPGSASEPASDCEGPGGHAPLGQHQQQEEHEQEQEEQQEQEQQQQEQQQHQLRQQAVVTVTGGLPATVGTTSP
mmetsp:Transcript_59681/g.107349  ORF Transcript_59681/g.107349 Transcript_59681/m.107349 type:complete len:1020 (-) Transcript_59681:33-3092(-)